MGRCWPGLARARVHSCPRGTSPSRRRTRLRRNTEQAVIASCVCVCVCACVCVCVCDVAFFTPSVPCSVPSAQRCWSGPALSACSVHARAPRVQHLVRQTREQRPLVFPHLAPSHFFRFEISHTPVLCREKTLTLPDMRVDPRRSIARGERSGGEGSSRSSAQHDLKCRAAPRGRPAAPPARRPESPPPTPSAVPTPPATQPAPATGASAASRRFPAAPRQAPGPQ